MPIYFHCVLILVAFQPHSIDSDNRMFPSMIPAATLFKTAGFKLAPISTLMVETAGGAGCTGDHYLPEFSLLTYIKHLPADSLDWQHVFINTN